LVEPDISVFSVRKKELSFSAEGGSWFLQIVWVYLANLTELHHMTLSSTKLWEVPIAYHMPRFNIHKYQVVEPHTEFLKRYAVSFLLHTTHGDVPLSKPVKQSEFIAVLCSGVTLTGGSGYK
jgi:hypothetical protein